VAPPTGYTPVFSRSVFGVFGLLMISMRGVRTREENGRISGPEKVELVIDKLTRHVKKNFNSQDDT